MKNDPYWFHKKWGLDEDSSLGNRTALLEKIVAELQEKYAGVLEDIKKLEGENIETSNCLYELGNSIDAVDNRIDIIFGEIGMNKENDTLVCGTTDLSPECQKSWDSFWNDGPHISEDGDIFMDNKDDKVVKWVLPVEVDGLTGDCYIQLPDDLLEAANLREGEYVEWVDCGDQSVIMKKVSPIS